MRYNPQDVTSTYAAISALNSNFDEIATLMELCVFRDGSAPNGMEANLDLNHFRVENLGAPVNPNDAVRLTDIQSLIAANGSVLSTLALSTGAALVGSTQGGTGAVSRTVQAKLRDVVVTPLDFGAVGTGADDTTAFKNCLAYAFANNLVVDGLGKTYGVTGNIEIDNATNPKLQNLTVKQLSPGGTVNGVPTADRRTLFFNNCTKVQTRNLVIDRGTDGTTGSLTSAAGMWVTGGTNHDIEIEMTGAGLGSGILIDSASNFILHTYAHDMTYNNVAAADDMTVGAWLTNCTDAVVFPRASDLSGNGTTPNNTGVNTWTRGLALGGCSRITIMYPKMKNVGQGVDVTGNAGNFNIVIIGGQYYQCALFGEKFANSAVNCKSVNPTYNRCGYNGAMISGPSGSGQTYKTQDVEIINPTCIDIGWNASTFSQRCGVMITSGGFDNDFPKGVKIRGGKAITTTGTMTHGVFCNITYDGTSKKFNEATDFRSEGHTVAAMAGTHLPFCKATGTSTQAIANDTIDDIDWDTEAEDTLLMHSTTLNMERITVPLTGVYQINGLVTFAANATGYRQVTIYKNGVAQPGPRLAVPLTGQPTPVAISERMALTQGDYVSLSVRQTSGGALNVDKTNSYFSVDLVKEN